MKKITLLCCLYFIFPYVVFSQTTPIKLGPPLGEEKRLHAPIIIASDNLGFYTLTTSSLMVNEHELCFKHFDADLKEVNSNSLSIREINPEAEFIRVLHVKDKLYAVARIVNRKTDAITFLAQEINKVTLRFEGKAQKLASAVYSKKIRSSSHFSPLFNFSADSSKIVLLFESPSDKGDVRKVHMVVFDPRLQPLWESEYSLSTEYHSIKVGDFIVANNGSVCLLAHKSDKDVDHDFNQYDVFKFVSDSLEPSLVSIFFDQYISNILLTFNPEQEVMCAGFYDANSKNSAEGFWLASLNFDSSKTEIISMQDFDYKMLTEYYSKQELTQASRYVKKGNKVGLSNLLMRDLIYKENGEILLIAEIESTSSSFGMNPGITPGVVGSPISTYSSVSYSYLTCSDIVVVNLYANGGLKWMERVYKYQRILPDESNDNYFRQSAEGVVSFLYTYRNDHLYLIYNDLKKNLTEKNPLNSTMFKGKEKNALIVLATINSEGTTKLTPLFGHDKTGVLMNKNGSFKPSDNIHYMFLNFKNGYSYAKIRFD